MKIAYINEKFVKTKEPTVNEGFLTVTEILNKHEFCRGYSVDRVFCSDKLFYLSTHVILALTNSDILPNHKMHVTIYHKCTDSDFYVEFCGFDHAYYAPNHDHSIYHILACYSHLARAQIKDEDYYFEDSYLEYSPRMWAGEDEEIE